VRGILALEPGGDRGGDPGSFGTSYQRCGFASEPWTPSTSAIVITSRAARRRRVLEADMKAS
jgi:hypothetical protein